MSATTAPDGGATLEVNTIGLIAGISVVATILLIICIVAVCVWCRNIVKKRKKDRSNLYMVQDGASPFSSLNGPPSGGIPSYSGASQPHPWGSSYFLPSGYDNKAMDVGEFRPNPLAENPYSAHQRPGYGVSVISLPPHLSEYSNGRQFQYHTPTRLAGSTQSMTHESQSLIHTLYDRLTDTVHERDGRPLYLCRRETYHGQLADHFDIAGKTRSGDWLVRPRGNVPDRPRKRSSKKQKAPKPANENSNVQRSNSYLVRQGGRPAPSMITTPFGAAERLPSRYLSGNHIDRTNNYEPQFTSLPRDSKINNHSNPAKPAARRQGSAASEDKDSSRRRQERLDEKAYEEVMKKNAINRREAAVVNNPGERLNPNRRPISPIAEMPHTTPGVPVEPTTPASDKRGAHRDRTGSLSSAKSLGITDQFKFLEQYDTEEERF